MWRVPVVALASLLAAAGCTTEGARYSALAFTPCTLIGYPSLAQCAEVNVPERWDTPGGPQVTLRVAKVAASEASEGSVFMLAGGPGQAATEAYPATLPAFRAMLVRNDVFLIDQRGTRGPSALHCDEPRNLNDALTDELAPVAAACLKTLSGRDFGAYGSEAAARDLEHVRSLIGVAQINLIGASYGTRLAMVYASLFPERVRSLVLDGVTPPGMSIPLAAARDAQASLDLLFRDCAADPTCHARFPDLRNNLAALLHSLREAPRPIELTHPRTGKKETVILTERLMGAGLRAMLYVPELSSLIPLFLDQASAGDATGFLGTLIWFGEQMSHQLAQGLLLTILCSEDAQALSAESIASETKDTFLGDAVAKDFLSGCDSWPKSPRLPEAALQGTILAPALLLSGELDPATPPRWAEVAKARVPNARHVLVPGRSHGTLLHGCLPDRVSEFIHDPTTMPDFACVPSASRPAFFSTATGPGAPSPAPSPQSAR